MTRPVCVVPAGDRTGEGACWNAAENALYWTDINRFLIHRLDEATWSVRSWLFNEPATAIALTDRPGTFVVSLASKVILWQPANDARADFSVPEKNPRCRLNDGRADPAGFFWVGSMQNNVAPDGGDLPIDDGSLGSLYRIGGDGHPRSFKTGIGISNTLCWSPDRRFFYFADTLRDTISVWDYDEKNGRISNERPFLDGFGRGGPDGSAVDEAGNLWNARYGGGCLIRISPDGAVDRVVDMPVDNITTCTFGGPDLRTLYITTAQGGAGPVERLAGSLYALEVEIPGLPENRVRLNGATP